MLKRPESTWPERWNERVPPSTRSDGGAFGVGGLHASVTFFSMKPDKDVTALACCEFTQPKVEQRGAVAE
jgi:hypothetical protein